MAAFFFLKNRQLSFSGALVQNPPARPVDKKLIFGSLIFGLGWGASGFCPGPAIANLTTLDPKLLTFLVFMYLGFEAQRKWA